MSMRVFLAIASVSSIVLGAFACGSTFHESSATTTCEAADCDGGMIAAPFDATEMDAVTMSDDTGTPDDAPTPSGCGPATYCAAVLGTHPLAYLRFEDQPPAAGGPMHLEDQSGHGYIAAVSPPYTLQSMPASVDRAGHGLRLDNGTVTLLSPGAGGVDLSFPNGAPFSISGWYWLDPNKGASFAQKNIFNGHPVGWGTFISYSEGGDPADSGDFGFEAWTTADLFSYIHLPAGTMPRGAYTHLAITYDGSVPFLYINGNLVGTPAGTSEAAPQGAVLADTSGTFTINLSAGYVDEFALYARALNPGEVLTLSGPH